MTCEDAIRNLLTLDNHTEIDDSTHAHLETCARCRAEHERLYDALSALPDNNTPFGSPAWEAALTDTVMQAVHAQAWAEASAEDDTGWVEYGRWLGAGVLILFGMLALPYTDVLVAVRTLSNGEIDFALAVSFGLITPSIWRCSWQPTSTTSADVCGASACFPYRPTRKRGTVSRGVSWRVGRRRPRYRVHARRAPWQLRRDARAVRGTALSAQVSSAAYRCRPTGETG